MILLFVELLAVISGRVSRLDPVALSCYTIGLVRISAFNDPTTGSCDLSASVSHVSRAEFFAEHACFPNFCREMFKVQNEKIYEISGNTCRVKRSSVKVPFFFFYLNFELPERERDSRVDGTRNPIQNRSKSLEACRRASSSPVSFNNTPSPLFSRGESGRGSTINFQRTIMLDWISVVSMGILNHRLRLRSSRKEGKKLIDEQRTRKRYTRRGPMPFERNHTRLHKRLIDFPSNQRHRQNCSLT